MLSALLAGGCLAAGRTIHRPSESDPPPAPRPAVAAASVASFARPPVAPDVRLTLVERRPRHLTWRFAMPSAGDNGQPGDEIRGVLHLSREPGPLPLAVILPIWGASDYPPAITARHLLRGRFAGRVHILRLEGEERIFPWDDLALLQSEAELVEYLRMTRERFRSAVVDVRRIVDWAQAREDIDGQRVGVVGFSIGAVVGAVALQTEPRLAGGVLVMGGGRLADIFVNCYREAAEARAAVLDSLDWDRERLRSVVRRELASIEPVMVAGSPDPSGILYIDAARDECIPERGRDELWEALGRPRRATLPWGHRKSFYSMTFLGLHRTTHQIVRFLGDRLASDLAPTAGANGELVAASPQARQR